MPMGIMYFQPMLIKPIDAKPEPASARNGTPALSGHSSHATFGNGRSQPPQNRVTATEATTTL